MQSNPFDLDSAYEQHADGLYRFCLRLVGSAQDAEDLVQETFLAAIAGRFDQRSSLATWLFRIARNKAYKHLRRRRLERLFAFAEQSTPSSIETTGFGEAVAHLPLALREAFLLVKVEGFTSAEAGRVLNVPEGTVRFRVHQAVTQLRSSWLGADEQPREGVPHAV